jgi:VCBS repeat-containing protein
MNRRPFRHAAATDTAAITRAEELATRRRRLRRRMRYTAAISVLATGGLFGIHAASAYWTAFGSGTGSAAVGAMQSVTASAGVVSNLVPDGTSHNVSVTVSNPNSFAVILERVTANGTVSADGSHSGCSPTGVTFSDQTAVGQTIPGHAVSTPVTLNNAAKMDLTSASACQGATFTIPVKISVQTP